MYGIAKGACDQARKLPLGSTVMLWTLDDKRKWAQACREGVQLVVTNRPLGLASVREDARVACQPST